MSLDRTDQALLDSGNKFLRKYSGNRRALANPPEGFSIIDRCLTISAIDYKPAKPDMEGEKIDCNKCKVRMIDCVCSPIVTAIKDKLNRSISENTPTDKGDEGIQTTSGATAPALGETMLQEVEDNPGDEDLESDSESKKTEDDEKKDQENGDQENGDNVSLADSQQLQSPNNEDILNLSAFRVKNPTLDSIQELITVSCETLTCYLTEYIDKKIDGLRIEMAYIHDSTMNCIAESNTKFDNSCEGITAHVMDWLDQGQEIKDFQKNVIQKLERTLLKIDTLEKSLSKIEAREPKPVATGPEPGHPQKGDLSNKQQIGVSARIPPSDSGESSKAMQEAQMMRDKFLKEEDVKQPEIIQLANYLFSTSDGSSEMKSEIEKLGITVEPKLELVIDKIVAGNWKSANFYLRAWYHIGKTKSFKSTPANVAKSASELPKRKILGKRLN